MQTLAELRFSKDRPKDPVYIISGRLSHAVRTNADSVVIEEIQRDLALAQAKKFMARIFEETPLTKAQAKELCRLITAAAAA